MWGRNVPSDQGSPVTSHVDNLYPWHIHCSLLLQGPGLLRAMFSCLLDLCSPASSQPCHYLLFTASDKHVARPSSPPVCGSEVSPHGCHCFLWELVLRGSSLFYPYPSKILSKAPLPSDFNLIWTRGLIFHLFLMVVLEILNTFSHGDISPASFRI